MRWLVERKPDSFEDVGAKILDVQDGCLVFRNSVFEHPTYLVAAGQWITVTAEDES
jgi:hypothetical protein